MKVHTVKLSRDTAGRRGKGVTVVSELPLAEAELKELATHLKNKSRDRRHGQGRPH